MVIGIGTDLVEVERIRASAERFGARFLDRVFTPGELRYCTARRDPSESLAARFAAKEAAAKALGCGLRGVVQWKEIEVVRGGDGAPALLLHGAAQELAARLGATRLLLSLSHTATMALAVALIEAGEAQHTPQQGAAPAT